MRMRRTTTLFKKASFAFSRTDADRLLGEHVTRPRHLLGDEDADELSLQSPEILEQAEDLVVIALVELLEIAEILLEDHFAGVGVEDGEVDVEDEPGRLD